MRVSTVCHDSRQDGVGAGAWQTVLTLIRRRFFNAVADLGLHYLQRPNVGFAYRRAHG